MGLETQGVGKVVPQRFEMTVAGESSVKSSAREMQFDQAEQVGSRCPWRGAEMG